jgi:hypothetical protein
MAPVIKYIIVNLLLFSSWYIFLFNKRGSLSFTDRLIGTFILGLAQIIATEMFLGIVLKSLFAGPLFLFNISISLIILSIAVFKSDSRDSLIRTLPGELGERVAGFFRTVSSDLILLLLFLLLTVKVCWLVFIGYLFPSYTWDGLWYHLPIVGNIIQSGAIQENPANFMIDTFINIFPKNMELFFLWNVIFLKSDIITDLSQLPFTIIGVITIYSIAVKLKIKERYALYSSFLFFFTPIIILQSTTNYIDVAVSVLFLITINFLLYGSPDNNGPSTAPGRHDRGTPLLLAGITAGILLGSKGSGLLFAVILSIAVFIQEAVKHRRHIYGTASDLKSRVINHSIRPYIMYLLLPMLLMGSYWYIKNWVLYNNPVYPMEISLFNKTIFKGLYKGIIDPAPPLIENSSSLRGLLHVWLERVEYYLYDSRMSGFGPVWFILFLPGLAFAMINAIVKKRYDWLFTGLLLIMTFIAHPRNWNTRYVIFIVALGAVSYGFMLEFFGKRERVINIIAIILAGYTFMTANSPCVMPSKISEFMRLPAEKRTIARHAPFNIDLHARQEYGHWIWVSENISEGDMLAYTFEPLFRSPLWNSAFSSRNAYVKADNYNDWQKMLKEKNVTYILLRKYSIEDDWIEKEQKLLSGIGSWFGKPKGKFKEVYSDKNYKIMKVLQAEG